MGTIQGIELVLVGTGVIVVLAYLVTQHLRTARIDNAPTRIALGIVPGVIGVALALTSRLDLVPDEIEGPLWVVLVVAVSAVAIVGTSYRLVRR